MCFPNWYIIIQSNLSSDVLNYCPTQNVNNEFCCHAERKLCTHFFWELSAFNNHLSYRPYCLMFEWPLNHLLHKYTSCVHLCCRLHFKMCSTSLPGFPVIFSLIFSFVFHIPALYSFFNYAPDLKEVGVYCFAHVGLSIGR